MANKESAAEIVRRIEELWDAGKLDELDQYFEPDFDNSQNRVPMLPPGLEGAKMVHQMSMQAFPDRKVQVLDVFSAGDKVAARCRMTGTNKGGVPWFGVGPNDAKIDVQFISIYEVKKGKVTSHCAVNDGITLLTQLGVIKPPGSEM